jgi:amidase
MVDRMKKAGAIIIGKTNTPEWGYGSQTYNNVYGTTANPYDTAKTCGGSSGGAVASLAVRMQAVADGSDVMGSLRNPAGWCNVYGYRPSWGRVPSPGFDLFLGNMAVRGPMARNVADLSLLLGTQSGYDVRVPSSLADDPDLKSLTPRNVHERLRGLNLRGRKIAWLGDWDGYLPMEPGVLEICEKALETFPELGVAVEKIKPPYDPRLFWEEIWLPLRHYGIIIRKPHYDDPTRRRLLKPEAVYEYEGSLKYTAHDLYNAAVKRSDWYKALLPLYEKYDYFAVPTAQVFPFDKNIHWPEEIAGRKMDTYHRWMEVVIHWTMSGNPVAAIPAGFNEAGLPMGIQLVGKPRCDYELLQTAYAYENAVDFGKARPALLKGEHCPAAAQ